MNWPGWSDILPAVTLALGLAGSVVGMFYVLMQLFRPAAQTAAREATDRLYDRLKSNDFDHLEEELKGLGGRLDARIDGVEARLDSRIDGLEARLDSRIDGLEARLDSRIDGVNSRIDGVEGRIDGVDARIERLDRRVQKGLAEARKERREMEERLLAAIRAIPVAS